LLLLVILGLVGFGLVKSRQFNKDIKAEKVIQKELNQRIAILLSKIEVNNKENEIIQQSIDKRKVLIRLKLPLKRLSVIVIALFLTMNVTGQLNLSQQKNNCFNDVVRDSILSKLYDRSYVRKRNTNLTMTLRKSDSTIIDYAFKDRLRDKNEKYYKEVLLKKDSINNSTNKLLSIEKKKKVPNAFKWGGIGFGLALLAKSVF